MSVGSGRPGRARQVLAERPHYVQVGATRSSDVIATPPAGYRAHAARALIGSGDDRWRFARREVLRWGVKTRSGFLVDGSRDPEPVALDEHRELSFRLPGRTIREPVLVVWIVDEPDRVGFGYGTRAGHPLHGEEAFVVDRDEHGSVHITVRGFSRAAGAWRLGSPLLRLAQRFMTRRYLRALAAPLDASGAPAAPTTERREPSERHERPERA